MKMKNGQYNFRKDLKTGEQGEDFIISYLEGFGYVLINKNYDNRYDFKMEYKGREYTYELKTDVYHRDTGNVAIEKECRGKESGISVCKSDFFLYFFPKFGELYIMPTTKLKKLISENDFYLSENSGDIGSKTKLYLIKKSRLKEIFKVHKLDM